MAAISKAYILQVRPMQEERPIYTLDIETDPFEHGRYPEPFAIGFYDGVRQTNFWGQDCIERMWDFIQTKTPGIIYAHNGGRFDIFYLMTWVAGNPMRVINSRIIKAIIKLSKGHHEFRDSYAIMPFALGKFKGATQKLEIEIDKLHRSRREKHKEEILAYLGRDCETLWILCSAFVENFGAQLTIGTTSMKELRRIHTFSYLEAKQDAEIRSKFYYGGRVECLKKGLIAGRFKIYDVNSMYPYAMKSHKHPIGKPTSESLKIGRHTCFVTASGENYGAFPMRVRNSVDFRVERGTFNVSIHEWNVAQEFGLFKCDKVLKCINFSERGTFEDFVDKFYNARLAAQASDDQIMSLFYKFIMNSAYGKFGQNPDNYKEYQITESGVDMESTGWIPDRITKGRGDEEFIVWQKPSNDTSRYNVATGSSITGAARSILLAGLASSRNPIYCDTDSIVCEELLAANLESKELGGWKLEGECDYAAIAGKKLYALFQGGETGEVVKQANKGVDVSAKDIVAVCKGETKVSMRNAPSFKLDGSHKFITRKVRMT